jgi:hypothetical protein
MMCSKSRRRKKRIKEERSGSVHYSILVQIAQKERKSDN